MTDTRDDSSKVVTGQECKSRKNIFGEVCGADSRVTALKNGTPVRRAGASPFWATDGIALGDEHGCEELAQSWFGGIPPKPCFEHRGLNNALYLLRDGDLMEVNCGIAVRIRRADFPQWLADEGCPWKLSESQAERIYELVEKIEAEAS
jgi:hypothetical protein